MAFARFRRQRPTGYRRLLVMSVVVLVLAAAWIYARATDAFWVAIPEFTLVGGTIGGLGGFIIGKLLVPGRIKRLPGYGTEVHTVLNDEGLLASDANARTTLKWAAFTRVVRFPDGIMFLRGRVLRWLPDSALQDATPEEATAFVGARTTLVEIG